MAIRTPEPFLSKDDKELLRLLSELVLEQEAGWSQNRSPHKAELTDWQARELMGLLESFLEAKRTQEASYFVEELFSGSESQDRRLREIFLSGRVQSGRTRTLATVQWREFLARLGARSGGYAQQSYYYRAAIQPMSLEYFYKMEAKLARAAGVDPRVRTLILGYIRLNFGHLMNVLNGKTLIKKGSVLKKPEQVKRDLKEFGASAVGPKPISTRKIAAVMTIVMDMSVLFTTRDWSVAGFMSVIAGATPDAILD